VKENKITLISIRLNRIEIGTIFRMKPKECSDFSKGYLH